MNKHAFLVFLGTVLACTALSLTLPAAPAAAPPAISPTTTPAPSTRPASAISPGDTLQIKVQELITPGQPYITESIVNELGDIKLFNLGIVHVADLSTPQAQEKIAQLAVAAHFLPPAGPTDPGPQVSVKLLKQAPPGTVKPGVLPHVGPADTLLVRVYELTTPGMEFSAEVQVEENGDLKVPNLPRIPVTGLTATEIEDQIAQRAVGQGLHMPKTATSPGPQVIVSLLKKAAPGEKPATIRPGDSLTIKAMELLAPGQFYSATIPVGELGDIGIPNFATFHVAGLTAVQVEEKIAQLAIDGGFVPPKSPQHSGPLITVTWLKKPPATTPSK